MAKSNSTPTNTGYRFNGRAFPLNTLTDNPKILQLAIQLHQQGKQMAEANENQRHFNYQPICIATDLHHIFGKPHRGLARQITTVQSNT